VQRRGAGVREVAVVPEELRDTIKDGRIGLVVERESGTGLWPSETLLGD
jgi:hypothetical protein